MRTKTFGSILEKFDKSYHPIEAAAAVSATGLSQTSALAADQDADKVASLSAATALWAAKMAQTSIEQVYLKTADNCLVLYYADNDVDLKVVARSCAKCGENPHHCIITILDNP
ncbi:MAG: hypothetical protein ACU837_00520 [Gammaproteobacteria bacterium]